MDTNRDDFVNKLITCYLTEVSQKKDDFDVKKSASNMVDTLMSYYLLSKQHTGSDNWEKLRQLKLNGKNNKNNKNNTEDVVEDIVEDFVEESLKKDDEDIQQTAKDMGMEIIDNSLAQIDGLIEQCHEVLMSSSKRKPVTIQRNISLDDDEVPEEILEEIPEEIPEEIAEEISNNFARKTTPSPQPQLSRSPASQKLDQAMERLKSRLTKSPVINLIVFYCCFRFVYMLFFF